MEKEYLKIAEHYESCLKEHGDSYLGVGWNDEQDVKKRFKVMLELFEKDKSDHVELLDFGCGTAHLYEYIKRENLNEIIYSGLDISKNFVEVSSKKYPDLDFYNLDILQDDSNLPIFDYVIMNGVFTQKRDLSDEEMFEYLKSMISNIFSKVRKGIAFNVMSKCVDWENEGNFYLSFDKLADYLTENISRKFVFRQDYGIYEYTTYVYK